MYCADGSGGEAVSAEEHGVSAKLEQERKPWHCPELHQMIVSAALDGAHAMAAFQDSSMSSVRPSTAKDPLAAICLAFSTDFRGQGIAEYLDVR